MTRRRQGTVGRGSHQTSTGKRDAPHPPICLPQPGDPFRVGRPMMVRPKSAPTSSVKTHPDDIELQ